MQALKKQPHFAGSAGPVVLVVMDGVGIGRGDAGDMVAQASKPNLEWLGENSLHTQLKAHGRAVGMPSDDDMGNSEVGHNAIGAGRVFDQGALLVQNAVKSGAMFEGDVWRDLSRLGERFRNAPFSRFVVRRKRSFAHRHPAGHDLACS